MVTSDIGTTRGGIEEHVARGSGNERAARRRELVDAAVGLFVKLGYHETTTRDIAEAAGWSVGALYEFVKSKGDILYHVCEVIHEETEALLDPGESEDEPIADVLRRVIDTYIRACDARQDTILLIYQEANCLTPEMRRLVTQNEERMTSFFFNLIQRGVATGAFQVGSDESGHLLAHNIAVFGQMWAFRRWYLRKHFTLDEYISAQTNNIMQDLLPR